MTADSANQHLHSRWGYGLLVLPVVALLLFLLLFLGITSVQIVHTARLEETHPADAIVVFGAAEYSGHPSPVLRARLDHAFDLYQRHFAPVVITTGGAAADPKFSEGGVGNDYLRKRGIPENALIAETQGSDTAESAQRVAVIMRANSLHSCIAVSDAYHVFRIRKLLEHEGVRVYVSPRPDSVPRTAWARAEALARESLSYSLWKLGVS
jgi:uncharacterized SAM-binding protein YcdF (DUF218 family)